jgi:hypothetical protein
MTKTERNKRIRKSNNPDNPNKNACALAVATALRVDDRTRYLHVIDDLTRATRTRYSVTAATSAMTRRGRDRTVGAIRKQAVGVGAYAYIVHVDGHVLLLNADGSTHTDTDSRKRDRRAVHAVYAVFPKADGSSIGLGLRRPSRYDTPVAPAAAKRPVPAAVKLVAELKRRAAAKRRLTPEERYERRAALGY